MLSFHQVCASYGKNQVLDHIDFSLRSESPACGISW